MQNRTFLRTMLDNIFNNAAVRTIAAIVKFCKEQKNIYGDKFKLTKKVQVNKTKFAQYDSRFIFDGKRNS